MNARSRAAAEPPADLTAQTRLGGAGGTAPRAPGDFRRQRSRTGGAAAARRTAARVSATGGRSTRSRPRDDGRPARRARGQGTGDASPRRPQPAPQRGRADRCTRGDARSMRASDQAEQQLLAELDEAETATLRELLARIADGRPSRSSNAVAPRHGEAKRAKRRARPQVTSRSVV